MTNGLATWAELRDCKYSWADIWQMHDILDLQDWIEWQHHAAAERDRIR